MAQLSKFLNNPQTLVGIFALATTTALSAVMFAQKDNSPELHAQLKSDITSKFKENGFKVLAAQDEHGTFGGLGGCYTLSNNEQTVPTHSGCASSYKGHTKIYALRSLGTKQ